MKEDRLANALIKKEKEIRFDCTLEIVPEAHYNHYGTRGVADLYIHTEWPDHTTKEDIYEIKANPQNANEVVRQFNKMCKYFHKGSNRVEADKVRFHLVFTAEPSNLKHVLNNKEIYKSLAEKEKVFLSFKHPNNLTPVHIFPGGDHEIGTENWIKHVKAVNHEENLDIDQFKEALEAV